MDFKQLKKHKCSILEDMKALSSHIKYAFTCTLMLALLVSAPVEAADSFQESKEEVEETKLFVRANQSVRQKPRKKSNVPASVHYHQDCRNPPTDCVQQQSPKYILYCNLIFYE